MRFIIVCVILAFVFGCAKSSAPAPIASSEPLSPTTVPANVVEPAPEVSALDRLMALPNLEAAIAQTKPGMQEKFNGVSVGALALWYWSEKNLHWSDVAIVKDETSFDLVRKDPDEERGKRLCMSGTIIEIQMEKSEVGKGAIGIILSTNMQPVHFLAAGSTGMLVANSSARICGVVTECYDYSNSAGGTGHAIQVVGMFDLPENKTVVKSKTK